MDEDFDDEAAFLTGYGQEEIEDELPEAGYNDHQEYEEDEEDEEDEDEEFEEEEDRPEALGADEDLEIEELAGADFRSTLTRVQREIQTGAGTGAHRSAAGAGAGPSGTAVAAAAGGGRGAGGVPLAGSGSRGAAVGGGRKRKALTAAAEDEEEEEEDGARRFMDQDMDAILFGRKDTKQRHREKLRRRRMNKMSETNKAKLQSRNEAKQLLGEANMQYASGKYDEALANLKEVIRLNPELRDAYQTLGLVSEAQGNIDKALDFYVIAAHLQSKDVANWRRIATLAMQTGNTARALYPLDMVLRRDRGDVDAKWEKATVLAEMGQYSKAVHLLESILPSRPGDPEAPKMLARWNYKLGRVERAIDCVRDHVSLHPLQSDPTHVNILAELYMEKGMYAECIQLITADASLVPGMEGGLPVDLSVKAGVCAVKLGRIDEGKQYFEDLNYQDFHEFADLYLQVGEALLGAGRWEDAFEYLKKLIHADEFLSNPDYLVSLAKCYRAMKKFGEANQLLASAREVLPEDPSDPRYIACLRLTADVLAEMGLQGEAQRYWSLLDESGAAPGTVQDIFADSWLNQMEALARDRNDDELVKGAVPVLMRYIAEVRATDGKPAHRSAASVLNDDLSILAHLPRDTPPSVALQVRRRLKYRRGVADRRKSATLLIPVGGEEEEGEGGGVLFGPKITGVRKDRRRAHIREADDRLDEALRLYYAELNAPRPAHTNPPHPTPIPTHPDTRDHNPAAANDFAPSTLSLFRAKYRHRTLEIVTQVLHRLALGGDREAAFSLLEDLHAAVLLGKERGDRTAQHRLQFLRCSLLLACEEATGTTAGAVRALCEKYPGSGRLWNLLAQALAAAPGQARGFFRKVQNQRAGGDLAPQVHILAGNNNLHTPVQALADYFTALVQMRADRPDPKHPAAATPTDEPLLLLLIANAYCQWATTRRVIDRHRAVAQSFAFLQQYHAARAESDPVEVYYNLGRVAHQLNILHVAEAFYRRCLAQAEQGGASAGNPGAGAGLAMATALQGGEAGPSVGTAEPRPILRAGDHPMDVRRECAHNLALIYRQSGSVELARLVLRQFLTV